MLALLITNVFDIRGTLQEVFLEILILSFRNFPVRRSKRPDLLRNRADGLA